MDANNPAFEWRDAPAADYAVLGDPVAHSLSPRMHHALYEWLGLPLTYVALRVPREEFPSALQHLKELGYKGVNCTVPLKEAAFEWCPNVETASSTLNTLDLVGGRGTNTDVPAFLRTLGDFATGPRILVLGAGGTAQAVVPALVGAGYQVAVWNRTKLKAEALFSGLQIEVVEFPEASGFDVVVNTTSAGLSGETPTVAWSGSGARAYDAGYSPSGLTPFLTAASSYGSAVLDGRSLLVEQGALAFEWWTGKTADRSVMAAAVSCP